MALDREAHHTEPINRVSCGRTGLTCTKPKPKHHDVNQIMWPDLTDADVRTRATFHHPPESIWWSFYRESSQHFKMKCSTRVSLYSCVLYIYFILVFSDQQFEEWKTHSRGIPRSDIPTRLISVKLVLPVTVSRTVCGWRAVLRMIPAACSGESECGGDRVLTSHVWDEPCYATHRKYWSPASTAALAHRQTTRRE